MLLALVLIVWTLAPIYNMVMVALESHNDVFTSNIWPADPSAYSFWIVFTEGYRYRSTAWRQYGRQPLYRLLDGAADPVHPGSTPVVTFGRPRKRHPAAAMAADQRGAADHPDPGLVPGHPV